MAGAKSSRKSSGRNKGRSKKVSVPIKMSYSAPRDQRTLTALVIVAATLAMVGIKEFVSSSVDSSYFIIGGAILVVFLIHVLGRRQ